MIRHKLEAADRLSDVPEAMLIRPNANFHQLPDDPVESLPPVRCARVPQECRVEKEERILPIRVLSQIALDGFDESVVPRRREFGVVVHRPQSGIQHQYEDARAIQIADVRLREQRQMKASVIFERWGLGHIRLE